MCKLCDKIDTMKEITAGLFSDEEIDQMSLEIGLEGFNTEGARLSIFIMAVVELCTEAGLTDWHIHDGVEVAIIRDRMRKAIERNNPGIKHTLRERLRGYES